MPWVFDVKRERRWDAQRLWAVGLLSGTEAEGFRRQAPLYFVMAKTEEDAVRYLLEQKAAELAYSPGLLLDPITVTDRVTKRTRVLGAVDPATGRRDFIYVVPAEDLGTRNFALLEDLEHGGWTNKAVLFPITYTDVEYQTFFRFIRLHHLQSHEGE